MKKKRKDTSNLIFSAFLITAFVICSYFFNGIIQDSINLDTVWKNLFQLLIFLVFGLLLFYATRIGDGKQVKRFSISTLILMDLPALYIIVASVWSALPFHTEIAQCTPIMYLAAVVLGYGIPYTFLSGYEQELPIEEIDETDTVDEETTEQVENEIIESDDEKDIEEHFDNQNVDEEISEDTSKKDESDE